MENARRKIEKLAQRILPEHPHRLCVDIAAVPRGITADFLRRDSQWAHPLEYVTNLSDADRGLLFTSAYYDIPEPTSEPNITTPSTKSSAAGEQKARQTKMSFKDYQNRMKASQSPMADEISFKEKRKETDSGLLKVPKAGDRRVEEPARRNISGTGSMANGGDVRKVRVDSRDVPESSEVRNKRPREPEGPLSPHKRSKTDLKAAAAEQPRPSKSTPLRSSEVPRGHARSVSRDLKDSQLAVNGRGLGQGSRDQRASPKPASQVNGAKSSTSGGSSMAPSRSSQGNSKALVPPLLSPLRLQLDGDDSSQGPRKRPADAVNGSGSGSKIKQREKEDERPPSKRPRSPSHRLPPLLSPTLPPFIQAELDRMRASSSRDDASQRSSHSGDASISVKKPRPLDPAEKDVNSTPTRPSRIVTFKIKKSVRQRVQMILNLPSAGARPVKKERSVSVEDSAPQAKKRPRMAEERDTPEIVVATSKKSKLSTDSAPTIRAAAPSTPARNTSTAMSRVASSTSQAHTPGDSTRLTPGAEHLRSTSFDGDEHASANTLRARHQEYITLGTKIKHRRDDILKGRARANGDSSSVRAGPPVLSPSDEKRVAVLHLEMILAFMVAFRSLNQSRALERKPPNPSLWEDFLPHLAEVRSRTRPNRALSCLALQLSAVCLEELSVCYLANDPTTMAGRYWKQCRKLRELWREAHERRAGVDESVLRLDVGPWSSVEEVVTGALRVLKRWADKERVEWRAEISASSLSSS